MPENSIPDDGPDCQDVFRLFPALWLPPHAFSVWPLFPLRDNGTCYPNVKVKRGGWWAGWSIKLRVRTQTGQYFETRYYRPRQEDLDLAYQLFGPLADRPPWQKIFDTLLQRLPWSDVRPLSCFEALAIYYELVTGKPATAEQPSKSDSLPPGHPTGFLGGKELADALGIPPEHVDTFLRQVSRLREQPGELPDTDWMEVTDRPRNQPRFLYRVDSPKIQDLARRYRHKNGLSDSPS